MDGRRNGVRFPAQKKDFSLLHSAQMGSEAKPASYTIDSGGCFHWVKRLGREGDHLLPSSAEVKNYGAIPPLPHYIITAWCLINYAQGQLHHLTFQYQFMFTKLEEMLWYFIMHILSRVRGSVNNNNGFWTGCLDLIGTSITITINYNSPQSMVV
jgi:hypothetical protein